MTTETIETLFALQYNARLYQNPIGPDKIYIDILVSSSPTYSKETTKNWTQLFNQSFVVNQNQYEEFSSLIWDMSQLHNGWDHFDFVNMTPNQCSLGWNFIAYYVEEVEVDPQ